MNQILQGHSLEVLKTLPDRSVNMCVTSPPYYGLRDYDVEPNIWDADENCDHDFSIPAKGGDIRFRAGESTQTGNHKNPEVWQGSTECDFCSKCNAWRGALGLEPTPELFVNHLVQIFREVRRVLSDDGTLWLNIGDSYSQSGGSGSSKDYQKTHKQFGKVINKGTAQSPRKAPPGLKPKDLIGIPWMLAFALRDDGWYLRSDIIWSKGNPMPESVQDRPTKAHEYIFLLSKSHKYYYDTDAIREIAAGYDGRKNNKVAGSEKYKDGTETQSGLANSLATPDRDRWKYFDGIPLRNKRTVWNVNTKPFPEAHFAVYPSELIEPCINAGSSKKGRCPECGMQWSRIVEVKRGERDDKGRTHSLPEQRMGKAPAPERGWENERNTVGWKPNCQCNEEPAKSVVLDPFFGSGTTGIVSLLNDREYLGIELNPEYIKIAENRIHNETYKKLAQREKIHKWFI